MKGRPGKSESLVLAALVLLATGAGIAWSQSSPPQPSLGLQEQPPEPVGAPPQQGAPSAQISPVPSESPGLLNEMGKMFDKILPPLKSPSETIDDLHARARQAAKDAGEVLSRLAPGSMVRGRMICPAGASGTPDCKSGPTGCARARAIGRAGA